MKYRALDPSGDYIFGKGSQDFLGEAAAVAQAIQTNLALFKGEWWEDLEDGLPMFQSILQNNDSKEQLGIIDMFVKERITSTQGVSRIDSYQSSYYNRTYSAVGSVTTTSGQSATVEVKF